MKDVNDLDKQQGDKRKQAAKNLALRLNHVQSMANAKYIRIVARETAPTTALSYVCEGCGRASRTGHPVGTLCKSCSKKQAHND